MCQIDFLNEQAWRVVPPSSTPLLLFKWSPSHREQGFRWAIHSDAPEMGSTEQKEPHRKQPTPSSLFRHWFWEDFRKCQTFLETGRSSQHWKAFLIDHPALRLLYQTLPSTNPSWLPFLPLTCPDITIYSQAREQSLFLPQNLLNYKFDWAVPHHHHCHQHHQH